MTVNNGSPGTLAGTPSITVNNGGTLALTNSDVLGYTTGKEALVINSGGQVLNNSTSGQRVTLQNTVTMTGGTLGGSSAGDGSGVYSFNTTAAVNATSDASGTAAVINAKFSLQAGPGTFNVTRGTATPAADLIINGAIVPFNGNASGVTKTGSGVLLLTAANTYTGATTVNAGSLFVSGGTAASYTGGVTASGTGTTFGGTGTVSGTVTVGSGSILAVGNQALATPTVGALTTGALTLSTGSTFNALLASSTSYSTLSASGMTALNGAFSISLTPGATFTNGSVLQLITSNVSGTFTNSSFVAGGYTFTADYTTNAGLFDVDVAPVPEPSTWIGGTAMVAIFGLAYRRRFARLG